MSQAGGKHFCARRLFPGFPLNFTYQMVRYFDGKNDGLVGEESFPWGQSCQFLETPGKRGISHGDISQYSFDCGNAKEYETFLKEKASNLEMLGITRTFLLMHRETRELAGYFSLSADTVRLTIDEKIGTDLEVVDFMSLPALKLGKLAINKTLSSQSRRKGYGSFMLEIANTYAFEMLNNGVACRFATVDADIEYDVDTPDFYLRKGFVINLSRKRRATDKTVSMRRDIFDSV